MDYKLTSSSVGKKKQEAFKQIITTARQIEHMECSIHECKVCPFGDECQKTLSMTYDISKIIHDLSWEE